MDDAWTSEVGHVISTEQESRSGGVSTAQETLDAEIFIDVRPMDAKAATSRFPVPALLGSGMQQAGIPDHRYGDGASVF
ncbi:hypothetical protein SynWH8101_1029 [Synechococcus sp. WH 8101]|nr:hypothetical protein SynWH8101_1029 [Synechococcus sp. WH 8101]